MNKQTGKKILLPFFFMIFTSMTGCNQNRDFSFTAPDARVDSLPRDLDIVAVNHSAADAMLGQAGEAIKPSLPILVTSFVNIDDLNDTSSFGRIVGEQVGSRITQKGYTISELRFRQGSYVLVQKKKGEFVLTRNVKKLLRNHHAQAILVGTYAVADNIVYVTTKLISPANNDVIASSDYSLPLGPNTRRLLGLDLPEVDRQETNSNAFDDPNWLML